MTQEYDNSIQDLLDWNICEKNGDGELKPTSDFLVWYYDYLLHQVTECYGENWELTIDPDNITEKQEKEMEEGEKEQDEFIRDCIENQIVQWTAQRIGNKNHAVLRVDEHVKIVYDLINDIMARRMEIHTMKTKSIAGSDSGPNADPDPSLDELVKEMRERREADLKQRQEAELRRKKEAERQQKKMSEYND